MGQFTYLSNEILIISSSFLFILVDDKSFHAMIINKYDMNKPSGIF